MSATQGFVSITENGQFVIEHTNLGHLGKRIEYGVTDVLNHAINHAHGINLTHDLLKLVNGDTDNPRNLTLLIQEQPTNQFFKVGWRDTIL